MLRSLLLALVAQPAPCTALRRPCRPRAAPRRCCATRSRSPRPASTRRRSPTSTRSTVLAHIFEAPLEYEFLAQPVRMRPNTAAALPEVSARLQDASSFTFAPGIYFADDPAFKGKRRELIAAGLRLRDQAPLRPALEEPASCTCSRTTQILGLSELRREAIDAQASRSTTTARSRACARSTATRFECELAAAQPAPAPIAAHRPGADRRGGARGGRVLRRQDHASIRSAPGRSGSAQWRRSSRIVLERNPGFREVRLRRAAAGRRPASRRRSPTRLKGRTPADGRPRRDRDHRGAAAALAVVPERRAWTSSSACPTSSPTQRDPEQQARAEPGQARHPDACATRATTSSMSYFAMENPVVGGYTPEKVALRRAISLAVDVEARDPHRRGAARRSPRSRPSRRGVWGYDPDVQAAR